jgi:hypothetical protein
MFSLPYWLGLDKGKTGTRLTVSGALSVWEDFSSMSSYFKESPAGHLFFGYRV